MTPDELARAAGPELAKALQLAREALDNIDFNGESGLTVIVHGKPIKHVIDDALKAAGLEP